MRKFIVFMLALMFTICSFASPEKSADQQNPQNDVGWNQDVHINQNSSLSIIESYDIVQQAEIFLIKVENVAIHTQVYLIEKNQTRIYKEPIAIKSQIYTKRRLTLDIQYIT